MQYAADRQARYQHEAEAAAAAAAERERAEREARLVELEAQAAAFRRANDIRAYVGEIRAHAKLQGTALESIETWASWALAEADHVDPILSGRFRGVILR